MKTLASQMAEIIKNDLFKSVLDTRFHVTSKESTIFIEWMNGRTLDSVVGLVSSKNYKIKNSVIYVDTKKEKPALKICIIYRRNIDKKP